MTMMIVIYVVLMLVLGGLWIKRYGVFKGSLAWVFRLIWTLPFLLSLYPQEIQRPLPDQVQLQTLRLLIDDSKSMDRYGLLVEQYRKTIEDMCLSYGCEIQESKLSEYSGTREYTRLIETLQDWPEGSPWILISDGADQHPHAEFPKVSSQGAVWPVGEEEFNVWIGSVGSKTSTFSFKSQPTSLDVVLRRATPHRNQELRTQVQVRLGDRTLSSKNVVFQKNVDEISTQIDLVGLPVGQNSLLIEVLPVVGEKLLADNQRWIVMETMPDTIGVLHVLGSPSWDGRYMRQFLKSEPKFDIISFYILRDMMDDPSADERELSLIPFPVKRLFTEELQHFRLIVVQNFSFSLFLQPEYQQNLVEYVKNGGSLLFIGGPRALSDADIYGSPLAELLPFQLEKRAAFMSNPFFGGGQPQAGGTLALQEGSSFELGLRQIPQSERAFVGLMDVWESLFKNSFHLSRRHKTSALKPRVSTLVHTPNGSPLVLASYPEKGRALWVLTDEMYKLALEDRRFYSQFYQSAATWLLRGEAKKPLWLDRVRLTESAAKEISWEIVLQGEALKRLNSKWQLQVCSQIVKLEKQGKRGGDEADQTNEKLDLQGHSFSRVELRGQITMGSLPSSCPVRLSADDDAFGELRLLLEAPIDRRFQDEELIAAPSKLSDLGVAVLSSSNIESWFHNHISQVKAPQLVETSMDPFWYHPWILWFFIAMMAEVIMRRVLL